MKSFNVFLVGVVFLVGLFFSCSDDKNSPREMFLEWEFEYDLQWYSAEVPGCIHTDLLHHELIPDPFFRNNEDSVQWVAQRQWAYRTTFAKDDLCSHQHIELVFEGLDAVAEVMLNGKPLKHKEGTHLTNNMFRTWIFPIEISMLQEMNELSVTFLPTAILEEEKAKTLPFSLPETRALTRKAQYQSGWDWGPKLVTCGIWKPAYLRCYDDFQIRNFQIYQKELNDQFATLIVEMEIESTKEDEISIDYFLDQKKILKLEKEKIEKGDNHIRKEITIKNPERWWTNGLGDQKLYSLKVDVSNKNYTNSAASRIGLRTVELIQEKDSIGQSFLFKVNGVPVFMKGTNWIPAESFPTGMTAEKYRTLLSACQESNMNMIRIWGGGIYEADLFYDLCDEMGLLVWQDFMFAGAIYPDDADFLHNIKVEATEQVLRLRNHPSLAIWCGNNEVKNAWEDWGWQANYTAEQKEQISKSIHAIFDELLPEVVAKFDPKRPYHPTSPLWGWGHPESFTEGDAHYWGVWWGEEPFEVWEAKTGRFMSEYGFQSYPKMNAIQHFTLPEDRSLHSDVMKNHQKHSRGVEIISKAIQQYFGIPDDFEDFVYVSQLVQAYGYGEAIEAHRRKMPYCMGTLYWQLNDCWPVASWSTIDYYGNKKAAWYTCRDLFSKVIISTEKMQNGQIPIWLISDEQHDLNGEIQIAIYDTQHEMPLYTISLKAIAEKNQSKKVFVFDLPEKFLDQLNRIVMQISFRVDDEILAKKNHYFVYPKELALQKPQFTYTVTQEDGGYRILLKSNVIAKGVEIMPALPIQGDFSENYFDLLPGEEKEIFFSTSETLPAGEEFEVRSWERNEKW